MARVPFIGRLFLREYIALIGSFLLIGLELIIRVITLALPNPVINAFYRGSRRVFKALSSSSKRTPKAKRKDIVEKIQHASDFVDMCALFGYHAEEHVVQTGDGYLLGIHRLGWRRGEEGLKVNSGPDSIRKKVVYLHHGLLMNSEVWACITDAERILPFQLVERGYDVWLGNNRGNKYSKKSVYTSPTSQEFWNFSMDQFAFHDIPDSIAYILEITSQKSLSYIGFSQGTAQAFATLSIHPKLNEQIDLFIALAPAMSPAGLSSSIVDALIKASPEVIFLAFGRRSILSSTTMWQAILYPPIFVRIIDTALSFLFNWSGKNISPEQKLAAYPHLYSFTSTKSVVHWFQIIRNKCFQMYDDEVQPPFSISSTAKYYKVPKFPTRNIRTPIALFYGGQDSLVDIKVMLKELPKHTIAKEIPHFEHLDFLWGQDVNTLVFPLIYDALESSANFEQSGHRPSSSKTTNYLATAYPFAEPDRSRLRKLDGSTSTKSSRRGAGEVSDSDEAQGVSYASAAQKSPASGSAVTNKTNTPVSISVDSATGEKTVKPSADENNNPSGSTSASQTGDSSDVEAKKKQPSSSKASLSLLQGSYRKGAGSRTDSLTSLGTLKSLDDRASVSKVESASPGQATPDDRSATGSSYFNDDGSGVRPKGRAAGNILSPGTGQQYKRLDEARESGQSEARDRLSRRMEGSK